MKLCPHCGLHGVVTEGQRVLCLLCSRVFRDEPSDLERLAASPSPMASEAERTRLLVIAGRRR